MKEKKKIKETKRKNKKKEDCNIILNGTEEKDS